MTQTPNVGLKKIDGSENWRNVFDYHNDSMDLADEAIAGVRAGLTYVENGDTIAANADYTEGKFICWKGEIYRVKATINTTVTSANWTTYLDKMDGIGGALSQINGDLAALNSKLTWTRLTEQTTTANTAYDSTITIPNVTNYNELMLSLQRASNGRTFATTVVPVSQFLSGAIYALGSYSIFSGNWDQQNAMVVSAVAIYVSDTQVEIAMSSLSESVKIRLYGR